MNEQIINDEIETFVEQSAPMNQYFAIQDDLPYRVSMNDCGTSVVLESPFGGHKPEWPLRRTEIRIDREDWPAIVKAVEANFAEAKRRAKQTVALDNLMGDGD